MSLLVLMPNKKTRVFRLGLLGSRTKLAFVGVCGIVLLWATLVIIPLNYGHDNSVTVGREAKERENLGDDDTCECKRPRYREQVKG